MIWIALVAINQMQDECTRKTKQTLFVNHSGCKDCYYCCYFVFFQDYGTFFICEGEEKPSDFIDIKQGFKMTDDKELMIRTWTWTSDE